MTHVNRKAWFFPFFTAVVIVQGVHLIEHIIQLIQVFYFGVPDDNALGLLGYIFQFQGTEEWLHLVFNVTYLASLYLLIAPLRRLVPRPLPSRAFWIFIYGAVVESWHMVEHIVIISHAIQNGGCPCAGIGDAALGVSDTILHFFYNAFTYVAILVTYRYVFRARADLQPAPLQLQPAGDRRRARVPRFVLTPARRKR